MNRIGISLFLVWAWACNSTTKTTTDAGVITGESLSEITEVGPVTATVTVTPRNPKLGDSMMLTLKVVSDPAVIVEMPPYGEALGRFDVIRHATSNETLADGKHAQTQNYTLQASRSGKLRIPRLRVEYTDQRTTGEDAGPVGPRELLTEELSLTVASVLPEGVDGELSDAAAPLDETPGTPGWVYWLVALAIIGIIALGYVLMRAASATRARLARVSAYQTAAKRLDSISSRGMPGPNEVDAWYVELSDIVRQYIEDATGVRAPELTTEEFLREAKHSPRLDSTVKQGVSDFLVTCDRVKFAGYKPSEDESQSSLQAARDLIDRQEQALRKVSDGAEATA
jgi:hypothetical protein